MKKFCTQCGASIDDDWLFCQDCGAKITYSSATKENNEHSFQKLSGCADDNEINEKQNIVKSEENVYSSGNEFILSGAIKSSNLINNFVEHVSGVKTYRISPRQMCLLIYEIYLKGKLKESQFSVYKKIKGTSGFFGMNTNLTSDDGRYILHIGHVRRGYIFGIRRNIWIKDCQTNICYEIGIYEHSRVKNGVKYMVYDDISPENLPMKLRFEFGLIPILLSLCIIFGLILSVVYGLSIHQKRIDEAEIMKYISENNNGSPLSKYVQVEKIKFSKGIYSDQIFIDYSFKNVSPIEIEKISFSVFLLDEELEKSKYYRYSTVITEKIKTGESIEVNNLYINSSSLSTKAEIKKVIVYLSNGLEIECNFDKKYTIDEY